MAAATLRVFSSPVGDLAFQPQSSSPAAASSPVFIGIASTRPYSPDIRDLLFFPEDAMLGERNTLMPAPPGLLYGPLPPGLLLAPPPGEP